MTAEEKKAGKPAPPQAEEGFSEIWVRILKDRPTSDTVWESLHDRYRKRILVYAHYRLGKDLRRHHEPEDVVNEAWSRIVSQWERFEYRGPDSLFHWLCLQVQRVILDRRRRLNKGMGDSPGQQGAKTPADVLDVPEQRRGPRTEVMRKELRDQLTQSLEQVPEIYRRVLVAVLLEGQTPGEAAKELDLKADTVRKQLARGTEHWRRALGGDPLKFI